MHDDRGSQYVDRGSRCDDQGLSIVVGSHFCPQRHSITKYPQLTVSHAHQHYPKCHHWFCACVDLRVVASF